MHLLPFRRARVLLTLTLACVLSACGGGGGDCAPTTPTSGTACTDSATLIVGSFMVENNAYNKGNATGYSQCVSLAAAGVGAVNSTLTWSWPVTPGGVRSYPELIYGQKPWYASTTSALPRVVNSLQTLSVATGFAQSHDSAANGNLAFDIWLTSSNQRPVGSDHLPIQVELMIWLDAFGGMLPAGSIIGSTTIGGTTWDVYQTTATWGPEPWLYVAYKARSTPASPLQLDVMPFLADLRQRGSISGQEWLASIEIGNEIVAGSGQTVLSNFSVDVK